MPHPPLADDDEQLRRADADVKASAADVDLVVVDIVVVIPLLPVLLLVVVVVAVMVLFAAGKYEFIIVDPDLIVLELICDFVCFDIIRVHLLLLMLFIGT